MKKAILAEKLGMTQVFAKDGSLVPVTVLLAGPCAVVRKKTVLNDGYDAVQVGFGDVKEKRLTKPVLGQFRKNGAKPAKLLREFRLEDTSALGVGDAIKADVFAEGDRVDVTGVTKGHGFAGAIKRHGMHRGPMAHGSKYHRALGSLSSGTSPGKVKKNKRMPGHFGHVRRTVLNLKVVRSDAERNLLLVKGAVPGPRGTVILVRDSVKVEA
jgi:large subunit ribosomal protein L3